jgi:hypothetical protein
MALNQSPKVVTDGLVFYYDMSNRQKSWQGAPTTNMSTGIGIGTYLNTPSDVTSSLTVTTETYRGQPVYKQVLTPITPTGVGYLTNAGNPGIGVVTGGGGGAAARFTGHSIFFKPLGGRAALNASTPIYTHYSNIGGWQSTGNFDDMGDGWYRAHVIYYNASGGSDGKYWAINPAGAVINNPITIYWAAPFKEDRNDSTFVSPYTNDTRSSTQNIIDLTGNNTITATSLTYASDNTFSFNGSNFITIPNVQLGNGNIQWTVSAWVRTTTTTNDLGGGSVMSNSSGGPVYSMMGVNSGRIVYWTYQSGAWSQKLGVRTVNDNNWHMLTWVNYNNNTMDMYVDGTLDTNVANSTSGNNNPVDRIGGSWSAQFVGSISAVSRYTRALTALEVQQNFNALRGRYGL